MRIDKQPSKRWVQSLNRRQRKKLYLAEFQEWLAVVKVGFAAPLSETDFALWADDLHQWLAERELSMTGGADEAPVSVAELMIVSDFASLTPELLAEIRSALLAQPQVATCEAELDDAWYGWG
ncbi:50S ribosome-binding protein YggL [Deefgea rivuli]|uniref:50S ribosome-binding protein YggL n=1 Tax=Deefgea rivuli TaxID=400948 RepID=UPI0004814A41|nr:50S ribosome-binding protein YggL [Deefgea rivuli]